LLDAVGERLFDALSAELAYRRERGYLSADPASPRTLELYLDRASRLKKHFHEVLFLEPDIFQVTERTRHLISAVSAVVASTWAFVWQIALASRVSSSLRISSGLVLLVVLSALVYAGKDRLKEAGRDWIAGKVHRLYGQRVARHRAPARILPGRDIVVTARESFEQATSARPDALNPESGASMAVTTLRFVHRGKVLPRRALWASGARQVKHVFRYDLSPLFARLHDSSKPVASVDGEARCLRFNDAPRCYRVEVRVRLAFADRADEQLATLVLSKRGLERMEPAGTCERERA
jgi:hypothetical protein